MAENTTHIIYTAADIQRYLEGKMSNGEMHAIERAALDDPLLAEAIEGYAGVDEKDWSATLESLKNKIYSRENTPVISVDNRRFRTNWKAAAAVALLLSGAGMAYFFTNQKEAVVIAEGHAKATNSDVQQNDLSADSIIPYQEHDSGKIAASTETPQVQQVNPAQVSSTPLAPVQVKELKSDGDFVYRPNKKLEDKPVVSGGGLYNNSTVDNNNSAKSGYSNNLGNLSNEASSSNAIASDDNLKLQDSFSDKDNSKFFKTPGRANNQVNSFKGLIVAKDNKPVAFAHVSTNQSNRPVYTDKDGYFRITSTDTILHARVNSAGYESKTFSLKLSDIDKKLVLDPATIAEKKLWSGKGNAESARAKARAEQQKEIEEQEEDDATPSNGWDDYNNYLSNNGSISDKNIHGVVEVFVNLDKNGKVSKIKVDKSLCAECDAEAVRLVKEGPKWDVKTNKATKVKVKVKF